MSPTAEAATPTHRAPCEGAMSTEEIKARIEAMFTRKDDTSAPTSRPESRERPV